MIAKLSEYVRRRKDIALFLEDIYLKGISEVMPFITNEVTYPELAFYFGDNVERVLDTLQKDGIVRAYVVDRVLRCPDCGTMNIRTRYLCPSCKSFNVEKVSLIEHLMCGYIGSSMSFKKIEDQQICPRCGRTLKTLGVDWRIIGSTFECYDCGYMFDEPKVSHICIPNNHVFEPTTSKYEAVYKYVIEEEVLKLVSEGYLINATVAHVLEDLGFKVTIEGILKGLSGVDHRFKILGVKEDKVVTVDTSNPTSSREYLMQMAAKVLDVKPTKAMLVVLSEEELKDVEALARTLNINLVVSRNLVELEEAIRSVLSDLT